jgi:hypothetical protein
MTKTLLDGLSFANGGLFSVEDHHTKADLAESLETKFPAINALRFVVGAFHKYRSGHRYFAPDRRMTRPQTRRRQGIGKPALNCFRDGVVDRIPVNFQTKLLDSVKIMPI